MPIVILGGGIIGLSTAYYLSKFTSESTPTQQTASLGPHGPYPPPSSHPHSHHAHAAHRHRDRPSAHHHHHHHHYRPPPNLNLRDNSIHIIDPSPELFASASGKAAGFLAKDWFGPTVAPLGAFSYELHKQLAKEEGGKEKWGWCESVAYSMDRDDEYQEEQQTSDVRINGDRNGNVNRSSGEDARGDVAESANDDFFRCLFPVTMSVAT
ncbi:hypothetical protein NLI96_g7699 [Meripilus lineatus]|uniref:FAD dependent oxidoreductase domain-containing protein n=1 Tax=Meripilus lineatus TaxID=2056292 RepID=A0AAD5V3G0_9APHY|nr:hypothetical protein NLI96_g7699 [Physisporinus lineatus]